MLCQLSCSIEIVCATAIQTEVETAAEAGWSTERSLCAARPRLGPSPAQRTIVSGAPSTVLMSWFVLPERAAVALVVELERPRSLRPGAKATGWCVVQIVPVFCIPVHRTLLCAHLFAHSFNSA